MRKLLDLSGVAFIVVVVTAALQLTGCAALEKLPPATQYTPDTQTNCIENHVWGQTVLGNSGPSLSECAATGWSRQRKVLDGAA